MARRSGGHPKPLDDEGRWRVGGVVRLRSASRSCAHHTSTPRQEDTSLIGASTACLH
jgi:hypothetical protein